MRVAGSLLSIALAASWFACDAPGGGGGGGGATHPDGWVAPDTSHDTVSLPPPAAGPPVEVAQYCAQVAQVGCQAALACGCMTLVGGNAALCDAYLRGKCDTDVTQPVAAGAYTFDAAKAGQCLAAARVVVADCAIDDHDVLLYVASHCDDFLAGARRSGDACQDDGECVAPLSCFGDVCIALPGDGAGCLGGTTCADGCYCDALTVCRAEVPAGGSCRDASYACADDLYCDTRTSTCQPYVARGQACAHATYACDDDLFCDAASGTCMLYPEAGASCAASSGSCADDLYCDDAAICRRPGQAGAPCSADEACASDVCNEGTCADRASSGDTCPFL